MNGYSATDVFSEEWQLWWRKLTIAVHVVRDRPGNNAVRCHELARAARLFLDYAFGQWPTLVDGRYGAVDHSWLVLTERPGVHAILDPYCVGRLPMVQLIAHVPGERMLYQHGALRSDIREGDVMRLFEEMRETMPAHKRAS